MFIINNARFCYKTDNKCYPQTFLKECEYIQEKIKTKNNIDDDDLEESDDE